MFLMVPSLNIPGSKSITNRAILIAALANGTTTIKKPLFSDDTRYLIQALKKIGFDIAEKDNNLLVGNEKKSLEKHKDLEIFIGNAGTTTRFLTTMLSLREGESFILTGEQRMHERPISDLVDALNTAGANIEYLGNKGCPPLKITGKKYDIDTIELDGSKSSQYVSSVLMMLPFFNKGTKLFVKDLVSKPYIQTTLDVMKAFGVEVKENNFEVFQYLKGEYQASEFEVPADASSASYFFAAAFLKNKALSLNVGKNCLQGDFLFIELLKRLGGFFEISDNETVFLGREAKIAGIHTDMNAIPDVVQTLAVLALFAEEETRIKNVANLRIKETDRLAALENELSKMGAVVESTKDSIKIKPKSDKLYKAVSIKTYEDHRMAMSFALAKLFVKDLVIEDPLVVSKSFENFWDLFNSFQNGN